ncbi:hypothetical protein C0J52_12651 [Blattella germanica]|nr:hypothetical protein C0J52_12651 [Blattella germanica]
MDHPSRGYAVIFHQYDYKKCLSSYTCCKCPSLEVKKLSDTLANLGFDVEIHDDLPLSKIKKVLKNLTENTDHTSADCIVIVMLAHGKNNNLLSAKKCTFPLQELWMPFCAVNCPSLAGKPKLFFIEACQAESLKGEMVLRRRVRSKFPYDDNYIIPNCADFLIVYNILKGGYVYYLLLLFLIIYSLSRILNLLLYYFLQTHYFLLL